MTTTRRVKLFRNGRNQALRIPRELELEGDEATLQKEGNRLIIQPVNQGRLLEFLSTVEAHDQAFPDVDDDLPKIDHVDAFGDSR